MRNINWLLIPVVFIGAWFTLNYLGDSSQRALKEFPGFGGDFTLTNHNHQKTLLSDYRGKVVLLNFGYTSCPDVCPIILAKLSQVMKQLEADETKVQVLFVTIDPERDTPDVLKPYVTHFHNEFVGLTGTPEEIAQAAKQYGVLYKKLEEQSAIGYLMGHSDYVYLIDKHGTIRGEGRYKTDEHLDKLIQDVKTLISS